MGESTPYNSDWVDLIDELREIRKEIKESALEPGRVTTHEVRFSTFAFLDIMFAVINGVFWPLLALAWIVGLI